MYIYKSYDESGHVYSEKYFSFPPNPDHWMESHAEVHKLIVFFVEPENLSIQVSSITERKPNVKRRTINLPQVPVQAAEEAVDSPQVPDFPPTNNGGAIDDIIDHDIVELFGAHNHPPVPHWSTSTNIHDQLSALATFWQNNHAVPSNGTAQTDPAVGDGLQT